MLAVKTAIPLKGMPQVNDLTLSQINEPEEIRVQKLSHVIADRLRKQIISGQRNPGDRLPPEAELLEQFQVSRPTIREALRILEVESLITLGRGARTGATIKAPSVERAAEYAAMVLVRGGTTMMELHVVRTLLEPPIVYRLTVQGETRIFDDMEQHLVRAKQYLKESDLQAAVDEASAFHAALSSGNKNQALNLIVEMLQLLSLDATDMLMQNLGGNTADLKKRLTKVIGNFQKLLDTMRQGDADEAQQLWHRYMVNGQKLLLDTGIGNNKLRFRPSKQG
ncbi:FadR/GntR family transcriptional regulator [Noviherbaspirillum sedimenti]|uniref:FadR family transcriptional regulator n=1 Tax=Noviherbaspirillum sedimenti TaxID=2320865 RepID=A0A3A3GIA8_9BURK|nr:GntR family transcriptional regulator [Noviherbaspirillum sedimenti]RJG00640.1 FadR family transcriptional regulator [Noviherbaspirillum sedimenti]